MASQDNQPPKKKKNFLKNQLLNSQNRSQFDNYLKYSGLAFQMLAAIGLAVWGGIKLDTWMGNKFPFFLMILLMLSIFATIYVTIKRLPKD
jgi:F0F1-type ATP synthase assembly protein I